MAQLLNLRIQSQSTEYVPAQVTATKSGQLFNPTGDPVYFYYAPVGGEPPAPAPSTGWFAGTWTTAGSTYIAQGLVGPANSGAVLAVGTYTVWLQVTDNPEVPVRNVGTVTIY